VASRWSSRRLTCRRPPPACSASVSRPSRRRQRACRSTRSTSRPASKIDRELYSEPASQTVTPGACVAFVASGRRRHGHRGGRGKDAREDHPRRNPPGYWHPGSHCRTLAFGLGLKGKQIAQFEQIGSGLFNLYMDCDASLVEVNTADRQRRRVGRSSPSTARSASKTTRSLTASRRWSRMRDTLAGRRDGADRRARRTSTTSRSTATSPAW